MLLNKYDKRLDYLGLDKTMETLTICKNGDNIAFVIKTNMKLHIYVIHCNDLKTNNFIDHSHYLKKTNDIQK